MVASKPASAARDYELCRLYRVPFEYPGLALGKLVPDISLIRRRHWDYLNGTYGNMGYSNRAGICFLPHRGRRLSFTYLRLEL